MIGLLIGILWALVYLGILAIIIYIILWAIQAIAGISLPGRIVQLIWVVFALICLIVVLSMLLGTIPGAPPWHLTR